MTMSRHTFTSFGGCDIFVICEKDKEFLVELQAITWEEGPWYDWGDGKSVRSEDMWAEGTFATQEQQKSFPPVTGIKIYYLNEQGQAYETTFECVMIKPKPESKDVWKFRAQKIIKQVP